MNAAQQAGTLLVSQSEIGDIAIQVDAENGYLAKTGDTLVIGMMATAMMKLQKIYEQRIQQLEAQVLELEKLDRITHWHTIHTQADYIDQLEAQVATLQAERSVPVTVPVDALKYITMHYLLSSSGTPLGDREKYTEEMFKVHEWLTELTSETATTEVDDATHQ